MFNFIWNFAKSNAVAILSKVKIKDVENTAEQVIAKTNKKVKDIVKEEKSIKCNEPKWQKRFPFSFVYGGGKFQPIYFFVTIFCLLASTMLFVKIYAAWRAIKTGTYESDMISTADLGVVLGFISSLILLYNTNKKNYISREAEPEQAVKKSKDAN